jgi:microcystin-dependent protein
MEPFVGEIRPFGFNYAPRGWAVCAGQLLPISQNTALFSILGISYGGDGRSTFALPNLQGAVPIGQGQGPGLSPRPLGAQGGETSHGLLSTEIPTHIHALAARGAVSQGVEPAGAVIGNGSWVQGQSFGTVQQFKTGTPDTVMSPIALQFTGGNQSHNNMMPFQTLNYCIALTGIFPQRP